MDDWGQFVDEVSWFLEPGESATVGAARPWSRGPVDGLPVLSALLSAATLTEVTINGRQYELLAWGDRDQRRGWLCLPPVADTPLGISELHRRFLSVCGGILERFGEVGSWWSNQNEVLTVSAAATDVGGVLRDYAWLWEADGLELPVEPAALYAVAVEANGNLTLVNRDDDALMLFAPDHSFDDVTPLAGCPPYSLMKIDDLPDLEAWVERCAAVWAEGEEHTA